MHYDGYARDASVDSTRQCTGLGHCEDSPSHLSFALAHLPHNLGMQVAGDCQ